MQVWLHWFRNQLCAWIIFFSARQIVEMIGRLPYNYIFTFFISKSCFLIWYLPDRIMLDCRETIRLPIGEVTDWEAKRPVDLWAAEGQSWASMNKKRSPTMKTHRPSDGPPSRLKHPTGVPRADGAAATAGVLAPPSPQTRTASPTPQLSTTCRLHGFNRRP